MTAGAARCALLDSALAAVDRGIAVFPVAVRGKKPAVPRWEDVATRDPDTVRRWYRNRAYNIGVATGPSGLVVVDIDDGHGQPPPARWAGARNGHDVLARLAAAAGAELPIDTYTVRTPTGGEHLYFKAPAELDLRNTAGRLGWRIDTRARGGYVVAAGSVRREGRYELTLDTEIAPLPGWLRAGLTPPPRPPVPAAGERTIGAVDAYVRAALTAECDALRSAPVGTRHHQLHKAARILGEFVGAGRLTEAAARQALLDATAVHLDIDGFSEQEAAATIAHGLANGCQRPRQLPLVREQAAGRHWGARR
jgi:hypothetical protein